MLPLRRARARHRLHVFAASVTGAALLLGGLAAASPATAAPAAAPAASAPPTVSSDPLPTVQINGVVWDQVIVGSTVYAVGSFTSARPAGAKPGTSETPRSNILAYDIRTGVMTGFAPKLNAQARTVAASPDGSMLYVGGDFTTVDGNNAYRIAAFNTTTGQRDTSFAPTVGSSVRAIVATSRAVYFGGFFKTVNGQARQGLAAVSPAGALLPWTASVAGGSVAALLVAPDQSRVVIGGSFSSINGATAYGSASVDATSGVSMPWALNSVIRNGGTAPGATGPIGGITSLSTDGQTIFGSGYNFGANSNTFLEGTFAADPTSGAVRWINDCNGDTYSTSPVNGVLYTVGHAHNCSPAGWFDNANDSSGRLVHWNSLAFTTAASGRNNLRPDQFGQDFTRYQTSDLLQWFPQWQVGSYTGQSQAGWAIESNADYVVVGGEFPKVGGVAQQGLVRFAVRSAAPNKVGPRSFTTAPSVSLAQSGGTLSATATASTWDPDDATLTYSLVRDAGKATAKVVTTQQASSTFWQPAATSLSDTGLPSGQQYTYAVRATDPWGNATTSAPVTVTTGSWSSVSGTNSTAFTQYVMTAGTSTLSGRTLTVPFTATGPSDMRRPDATCLSNGSTTLAPSKVSLTTDAAGSYAGTLTYQLPGAGSYSLQYSCGADYSTAPVGAWDGSAGPVDPTVSQAYDGTYSAKVGTVTQSGRTVSVAFSATGPSDLLRPEGTCVTNGTQTVRPTSSSLTTDRAGAYAGTLVYTLPEDGTYTLQYACSGAYSQAKVGTFTGITGTSAPVTSTAAGGQYTATVQKVTQSGSTLTVSFSAAGPADLRRPEATCLSNGTTTVAPTSSSLTTDRTGAYAGTLVYTLPSSGAYTLQYACFGAYSQAPIGTFTVARTTPAWSAVAGGTSTAGTDYVVTVGQSTLSGTTLTVPFSAKGPSDLRRPENTCLTSGGSTLKPTGVSLTSDQPGSIAGSLTYQLSAAGSYALQYSCAAPYTSAQVGTYAP